MPISAEGNIVLLDTSVAVALVVEDHEYHQAAVQHLTGKRLGLSGHAMFETFSVLTRLPGAARRSPQVIANLLQTNFPETRFLSAAGSENLVRTLMSGRIAGGAIYDALVAATANEHDLVLVTNDYRAFETYRLIGGNVELLS